MVSLLVMRIGFGTTLSRLLMNFPEGARLRTFLLFRAERPQTLQVAEVAPNAASS
jgi:hypothetical protein